MEKGVVAVSKDAVSMVLRCLDVEKYLLANHSCPMAKSESLGQVFCEWSILRCNFFFEARCEVARRPNSSLNTWNFSQMRFYTLLTQFNLHALRSLRGSCPFWSNLSLEFSPNLVLISLFPWGFIILICVLATWKRWKQFILTWKIKLNGLEKLLGNNLQAHFLNIIQKYCVRLSRF